MIISFHSQKNDSMFYKSSLLYVKVFQRMNWLKIFVLVFYLHPLHYLSGQILTSRTDQRHQSILREKDVRPKVIRRESVLSRRIFEFESYRDGQLFHFNVPLDTKTATWKFLVNATEGCRPGKVSV